MGACNYLGIYPDMIEDAADTFDLVCEQFGIDADKAWERVDWQFQEFYSNLGNAAVEIMFYELMQSLIESGVDKDRIDYYVNGTLDTTFYIDGEAIA